MKVSNLFKASVLAVALAWSASASAHCDTLNLVLVWVQKDDEAELRRAFHRARSVRKAGGEAKELADLYFFETLVRVHRAGEGAAYTGLKPAGAIEPPVAAAPAHTH